MKAISLVKKIAQTLVANRLSLSVGLVMITGAVFAVSWMTNNQQRPAPRKVVQLNVVQLQKPEAPVPKLPPPKPLAQPKVQEEQDTPLRTRVKIKMTDIPPDAPPPSSASQPPPGGPLALAAAGDGPGDAFGLAGNPGGRSFLGVGGGDGAGSGIGGGGYDPNARYGWYYAKIASRIEQELQKNKELKHASVRIELRVWTNGSGQISRVQPIGSTGDENLDQAIRSLAGLTLKEKLPDDIPQPLVLRVTARRPV